MPSMAQRFERPSRAPISAVRPLRIANVGSGARSGVGEADLSTMRLDDNKLTDVDWVRLMASALSRTSMVQVTMRAKAGSLDGDATASGSWEIWSGRSL